MLQLKTTIDLIELLTLEESAQNEYLGKNNFMGSPNIFGGQLLAQGISAAINTVVIDKNCHSLHAYFLQPGDLNLPVKYQVNNLRDGNHFATRQVIATQNGQTIFTLMASFQDNEDSFEYQINMPNVPAPESLNSWMSNPNDGDIKTAKLLEAYINIERPVEMRSCYAFGKKTNEGLSNPIWIKFKDAPQNISQADIIKLITYVSDYNILATALLMQPNKHFGNIQAASIDHALWFHNKTDLSDWLLFDFISPESGNSKGFALGRVYNRAGKLIASMAQEGLLREKF